MAYPSYDTSPVLMGKPNQLPYDIQTAQSSVQRKKLLVKKLIESAMERTGMIDAGQLKVANWGDALGKVAEMYFGTKALKDIDKEEADVARKLTEVDTAAGKAFERTSGGFERDITPTAVDDEGNQMPRAMVNVPGDQKKALLEAAMSGSSRWQGIGIKGLEEMIKEEAKVAAESKKPYRGFHDGYFLEHDPVSGQMKKTPIPQYGPPAPARPDMPATVTEMGTGETKALGGGHLPAPIPGKEYNTEREKETVRILSEGRKEGLKGIDGMRLVGEAKNVLSRLPPEMFGPLAEPRIFVAQLAQSFGIPIDPKVTDLATLRGLLGNQLIDKIRLVAPVSDTDVKIMRQIVGSVSDPRTAVEQILKYTEERSRNSIMHHKSYLQKVGKRPEYADISEWDIDIPEDLNLGGPPAVTGYPQSQGAPKAGGGTWKVYPRP